MKKEDEAKQSKLRLRSWEHMCGLLRHDLARIAARERSCAPAPMKCDIFMNTSWMELYHRIHSGSSESDCIQCWRS